MKSGGTSRGKEVYAPHSVCGIERDGSTPQFPDDEDYECHCVCD